MTCKVLHIYILHLYHSGAPIAHCNAYEQGTLGDWRPSGDFLALNKAAIPDMYSICHLYDFTAVSSTHSSTETTIILGHGQFLLSVPSQCTHQAPQQFSNPVEWSETPVTAFSTIKEVVAYASLPCHPHPRPSPVCFQCCSVSIEYGIHLHLSQIHYSPETHYSTYCRDLLAIYLAIMSWIS